MGRRTRITGTNRQQRHHIRSIRSKPTQTHIQPIRTKIDIQEQTLYLKHKRNRKYKENRFELTHMTNEKENKTQNGKSTKEVSVETEKQKGKGLTSTKEKTSNTHRSPE